MPKLSSAIVARHRRNPLSIAFGLLLRFMKRLVLILIMLIVPLQSVWAAASAYCTHEADAATGHFGHHSHQHGAGKADGEPDQNSPAGKAVDNDCGLCHLGHCSFLNTQTRLGLVEAKASPILSTQRLGLSDITARPERPNWPLLA